MLIMRTQQMAAFDAAALGAFEDDMLKHAANYFPNHLAIQGEACTRSVIRLGAQKAGAHGLTERSNVCRYLNLMWMFGSYFDADPLLPWAAAILAPDPQSDPTTRMMRTAQAGLAVFEQTAGPDHSYLNRALLRLHELLADPARCEAQSEGAAALASLLASLFPARAALLSPADIEGLHAASAAMVAHYGLAAGKSHLMLAMAKFFCGSGCDVDPQHHWLAAALAKLQGKDALEDGTILRRAAHGFVSQWLERRN